MSTPFFPDWQTFSYKYRDREQVAFENLARTLFRKEMGISDGLFQRINQQGNETDVVEREGKVIGFQAKYFSNGIRTSEIIDSMRKAKEANPRQTHFYIYSNKSFGSPRHRKGEISTDPLPEKTAKEKRIALAAQKLGMILVWKLDSTILDEVNASREIYDVFFNVADTHDLLWEIRNELCTHNRGKREFERVEGYIERDCSLRLRRDALFQYFLRHDSIERYRLSDIVSGRTKWEGHRFILYGDAQSGKTTEFLQLGWILQEEGEYVPVMYRIRGCQSIKQELPALRSDLDKKLVIIIDALDEKFDGDARFGLYHEIASYAEEHPQARMVVTCRESYHGEFSFGGFTELTLNDLTRQDSEYYLKKAGVEHVVSDLEQNKLNEFIRTPFYLQALADYYKEKQSLPGNKGELYDYFINRRLVQEEKLRLKQDAEMCKRGKDLLQKMAVALQLMGMGSIGKEELLVLYENRYDDFNRLLRTGLIEEEKENSFCFTHNSFKEYFVSRYMLSFKSLEEMQKLCCYHGTGTVRTGWNNIVALLLAQLPDDNQLSRQIRDWIVEDNKELVLYIDKKLFSISQRIAIFKDIIEWHKTKGLRLDDLVSSKYEDLMNFGLSIDSIDYLMAELAICTDANAHLVNILFLIRFLHSKDLTKSKAEELKSLLLTVYASFKDDDEFAYVFFEVFRSPWLMSEEMVDAVYGLIKDSENPSIVNHFIQYVTEAGCVERYIDIIVAKSRFIHDYRKDFYIRNISRNGLYNAYLSLSTWESILKALRQLVTDYQQHLYDSGEVERYDRVLGKMLEKVSRMITEHPDAPDIVYEMLLQIAEYRGGTSRMKKDAFRLFFDKVGLSQRYFERSLSFLKGVFIDSTLQLDGLEGYKKIESNSYCVAMLLDESRLNHMAGILDDTDPKGYSLLDWISQYATQEYEGRIDHVKKTHYPDLWRDRHAPTPLQKREQLEYNELMDYDRFKEKVLRVIEEKAPKNRDDLRALRRVGIHFSDEEEEKLSRYVMRLFYRFYDEEKDIYDLEALKEFVEDYRNYQKLIVNYTAELLYNDGEVKLQVTEDQKRLFKESAVSWLKEISEEPYGRVDPFYNPAIQALLHHDVIIDETLLLRLLPYSSSFIYRKEDRIIEGEYSLFDYVCERMGDNQTVLLNELRNYMDRPVQYVDRNWKAWGVYLIKNKVSSEYDRIINVMLSLPASDTSMGLARELLDNEDTRMRVLGIDVMARCGIEKRLSIYEHLANDPRMNEYVKVGLERDFDQMNGDLQHRALRLLLSKGSMKGLEYVDKNPSGFGFRSDYKNYTLQALPLLLSIYDKAISHCHRAECYGLLNSIESIAEVTDEGWESVNQEFGKLIQMDTVKYQHLNWYLRNWSINRLEKASPLMTIDDVKKMFNA